MQAVDAPSWTRMTAQRGRDSTGRRQQRAGAPEAEPVVARVMTATARLHDDLESWLAREVAVGTFSGSVAGGLPDSPAAAGATSARRALDDALGLRPTNLRRSARPDGLGHSLRELHVSAHGVRGRAGAPPGRPPGPRLLLDELQPAPSLSSHRLESLRTRLEQLTRGCSAPRSPTGSPGDTGIRTCSAPTRGCCGTTSSDVCSGPVARDVTGLCPAPGHVAGRASWRELLHAYGAPAVEDLVDFIAAHEPARRSGTTCAAISAAAGEGSARHREDPHRAEEHQQQRAARRDTRRATSRSPPDGQVGGARRHLVRPVADRATCEASREMGPRARATGTLETTSPEL